MVGLVYTLKTRDNSIIIRVFVLGIGYGHLKARQDKTTLLHLNSSLQHAIYT